MLDCHALILGEAELPLLVFTGEATLTLERVALAEPVLILLGVGVLFLGAGVGLLGGGDSFLEGEECLIEGGGLELVAENGLLLDCNELVLDLGDGLRRRGLGLPLPLL